MSKTANASRLAITDDHQDLAEAASGQLGRLQALAKARATLDGGSSHPADIWSAATELGWTGLAIAEECGGSGFGLAELAVVAECLGRHLAPGPFLPSAAAAVVIDRCAPDSVRTALLPGLASGDTVAALALSGTVTVGADLSVTGESSAVLAAPDADLLVLVAGEDIVIVDADSAVVTPLESLDSTRSIGSVTLSNVPVPADRVIRGAARNARTVFRTLAAGEAVGVSWAALDMAVEYAKVREQFGRTIGTFQAVKHHAANMLVNAEVATAATWDAARADDLDSAWFAAAVAAALAIRAQVFTAQTNIQLHGGIGFTWEHDAHLYLRRARTLAALMADGVDPLLDVVEGQRSGQAHGASFTLPPESEAYRTQAREVATTVLSLPADQQRDYLVESGYLVPHWPKPWGRGADVLEQLVIEEEFGSAVDRPDMGITGWVALTIAQAGTDEQRERWVEPVLRGQVMWCQLFSEPGAGSDAAAVRTSAKKVDGGWRVTGQKVWTSLAHMCQWGLATVRTDPDAAKHAGVTMMAIDMNAEGVTVNPLRGITGDAHFNEVFFDDVFVPDDDVVGDVNKGWLVARATLGNERISIGGGSGGASGTTPDHLIKLLDSSPSTAAMYVRRAGEVIADIHTLRLLNLRRATRAIAGAEPGPEGNVTKLLVAESGQQLTELAFELAGTVAVVEQNPQLTRSYLGNRAMTIAGGTSEITRNTIAERILGLPRDPLLR